MEHTTGTRAQWQAARDELLKLEEDHAELGRRLAEERRKLPWVPVEKEYAFATDEGEKTLAELFDGRSQLLAYHVMFGPDYSGGACPGCTGLADHLDAAVEHLNQQDVTLLAISRAPLEMLQAYKRRMDWSFPWVSSRDSDYPLDFGWLLTEQQMSEIDEVREMVEDPPEWLQDWSKQVDAPLEKALRESPGWIAFALEDGVVHHTYSRFAPDGALLGPYYYQLLDQTAKGRNRDMRAYRRGEYPSEQL